MIEKLTRQGVRDLNGLGPKEKKEKIKTEEPPPGFMCKHVDGFESVEMGFVKKCKKCGAIFNFEGKEI